MKKLVSIVVSLYNEEENVGLLYKKILEVLQSANFDLNYEVILVNDGSIDKTLNECFECKNVDGIRFKIVSFVRNFGHEMAMTAGLDNSTGEAVIFMDGDLQHPPEILPQMIEKWLEGNKVVLTKLVENKGKKKVAKLMARLYYNTINAISTTNIPEKTPDFRLISGKYIEALKSMGENARMFRGMLSWLGLKDAPCIEFVAPARVHGVTKYNLIKSIELAVDSIVQFSIKPLRFASYLGVIGIVFAASLTLITIYEHFVYGNQSSGYATIICAVAIFGSIQLLILGIIGEYIGRIHIESKKRPLYFAEVFENE
ncbi:MAG: hypothetical protein RL208_657 [Pseudomonadota bacterium]|jgi:dolichol-phosphate mannosyltransferase